MKKLFISGVISAFLFSMSPTAAQNRLAAMPEQELKTDLVDVTVCMMDNLVAVKVAEKIYKEADQQQENRSGAALVAIALSEAIDSQQKVAHGIVEVLVETYKMSTKDIEKFVTETIEAAKADMVAKLRNVSTVEELMQVMKPTIEHCSKIADSFGKRIEKLPKSLESEK